MRKLLIACWRDEEGTEIVEYALLLGLIVIGAIGLMGALGIKVVNRWQQMLDVL